MGNLWGLFAIELMVKIKRNMGGIKRQKQGEMTTKTLGGRFFPSLPLSSKYLINS